MSHPSGNFKKRDTVVILQYPDLGEIENLCGLEVKMLFSQSGAGPRDKDHPPGTTDPQHW